MDAAIEKVIETFGMMRNLTASEMANMRMEVTSHLAKQTGHNDHDLVVAGLSFLRRLSESAARFERRDNVNEQATPRRSSRRGRQGPLPAQDQDPR